MIASPAPSLAPSSRTVCSVISPAGTMHHAVFGDSSLATNSSSDAAAGRPFGDQLLHRGLIRIEHDRGVPAAQQPAHHVRAHPTESDHAYLHRRILLKRESEGTDRRCVTEPAQRGASSTRRADRFETGGDVRAEVDAQGATAALGEHREVAAGLRRLDDAEGVALPRHGQIAGVVGRDLQEHALVRAALVGLAGRVQEARPEADAGGDVGAIPDAVADPLQHAGVARVHLDVGEERDVVAGASATPGARAARLRACRSARPRPAREVVFASAKIWRPPPLTAGTSAGRLPSRS